MAVLGCQPVSLFPAWSCQWKSCWKNSRKELSFLHSIDQVNTLPRVSLKRLLWCFRVEKCILNVKRCLVIFKTEHENTQQKAQPCGATQSCARMEQGWKTTGPYPAQHPVPAAASAWSLQKKARNTGVCTGLCTGICPADCAVFHSTPDEPTQDLSSLTLSRPLYNSAPKSCLCVRMLPFSASTLEREICMFQD